MSQPSERPPRPAEPIKPPPKDERPAVDRALRRKPKRLAFSAAISGGAVIYQKGTWICPSLGVTYGNFGFGIEAGYCDYRREFIGNAASFVSPGTDDVSEHGSLFKPALYAEYRLDFSKIILSPKSTLGYSEIISKRWSEEHPDTSHFDRDRLTNTWELNIGVPVGPIIAGATVQWWVINPWFYFYPEDIGMVTTGLWIKLK